MKIEELEQIIKILKQNEVNEFEFDNDGVRIKLVRGVHYSVTPAVSQSNGAPVNIQPAISSSQSIPSMTSAPATPEPKEDTSHLVKVDSPIVGTFYRKPSPDAAPFVSEGSSVKKGDTLCIVEAMKLMNEIESPVSGKIEKVLVSDGQVIEFGEVLFLINPKA